MTAASAGAISGKAPSSASHAQPVGVPWTTEASLGPVTAHRAERESPSSLALNGPAARARLER
jgi:hypothetical protein